MKKETLILPGIFVILCFSSGWAQVKPFDAHNSLVIHQEVDFAATPQQVYQALLSSKEFSASVKKSFANFSDASCTIDPVLGGTFSLFDGHIGGRNLELIPNQRIVQSWRVVDWPAGVYSIARFELK